MNQKNNKRLEFKLPESLLTELQQVAESNNVTTSELAREGLKMALKKYKKKRTNNPNGSYFESHDMRM